MIQNEKQILIIIACILIFMTGLWLFRIGKPYQTLPLTIHKLISLAVVVLLVVAVRQSVPAGGYTQSLIMLIGALGIAIIGSFATGGVISAMKEAPLVALIIHRVSSIIVFVLIPVVFYLVRLLRP